MNMLYNNLVYLFNFALICHITSLMIIKYRKNYAEVMPSKDSTNFKDYFLRYLDQYYIKSKWLNFLAVFIYIFLHAGIFYYIV